MGFFKRLFSPDYRAAVAAEAAGDLDLAAERYALAGQTEAAVRMHLARAERADRRADEIAALRDALHWAPSEGELRALVAGRLGRALLARAEAEGVATERDRERVREAAALLVEAGDFGRAGAALESIGDDRGAAAAYRRGGLVERLETALDRDEERALRQREEREAFADYQLHLAGGDRDSALTAARRALDCADNKAELRRLVDDLESRIISSGRVVLQVRGRGEHVVCTGSTVTLGRDPLCDLVLRSGSVSRRHAEICIDDQSFSLRDHGSRNGTLIGGLPIDGSVPLTERGCFSLGDQCAVDFKVDGGVLQLAIDTGLDAGKRMSIIAAGQQVALSDPDMTLRFRRGRPLLGRVRPGQRLTLGDQQLAHGDVQLIHGDVFTLDGFEVEVV